MQPQNTMQQQQGMAGNNDLFMMGQQQPQQQAGQYQGNQNLIQNDIDSSLAKLAGNLSVGAGKIRSVFVCQYVWLSWILSEDTCIIISNLCIIIDVIHVQWLCRHRTDQQWTKPAEKKLTGGSTWQNPTMASATMAPMAPMVCTCLADESTVLTVSAYSSSKQSMIGFLANIV